TARRRANVDARPPSGPGEGQGSRSTRRAGGRRRWKDWGDSYDPRAPQAAPDGGARAAGWGRAALWATGIATLFVALVSPLDVLGEQFATFHMVQHLLSAHRAAVAP